MGEIRLLRELEEDLEEKQLQRAIEADLTALEDNLQYVASEVVIGTGRIDTLAVDEDGRPTFIEYKRAGKFDRNALVQLMDYLAWFTKNPTHFLFLADYVKRKSPKVAPLEREVRLILVVSDADERVRNACYVIKNPVTIFTYTTARLENGDTVVLPREILDNADVEVAPEEEAKEEAEAQAGPLADELADVEAEE